MPSWLCFLFFLSLQVLVMIEGARTTESYFCRDSSCSQGCTVEISVKVGECQTVNVNMSYKVTDCSGDEGETEVYADGHCGKLISEGTFPIGSCQKYYVSANSTATLFRIVKCKIDPVVIVLACVGGALFLGAVVAGVFWWWRRRQTQQRNAPFHSGTTTEMRPRSELYGDSSAAPQYDYTGNCRADMQPARNFYGQKPSKEQAEKGGQLMVAQAPRQPAGNSWVRQQHPSQNYGNRRLMFAADAQ